MSRQSSAWMPVYIGDYLGDTQRLTTEQHGAYLLLIFDYWRNGPPPDDDAVLQQITKLDRAAWKKHRPTIARLFKIEAGEWRHKRIEQELADAEANAERRSSKARAAAEARWGHSSKDARSNAASNARSMPGAMLGECPPPSPSPEEEKERDISSSSSLSLRDDDDDGANPVSIAHSLCRQAGVSVASPKAIATAAQLVRDWQQAGATPDLMGAVIADALPKSTEPISSLRYFDKPIRHRIALEANGHGSTLGGHRESGAGAQAPSGELGRMAAAVAAVRAERLAGA